MNDLNINSVRGYSEYPKTQAIGNAKRKPPMREVKASVYAMVEQHNRTIWQAAGANGIAPLEAFEYYREIAREKALKAEERAFQRGKAGLIPLRRIA